MPKRSPWIEPGRLYLTRWIGFVRVDYNTRKTEVWNVVTKDDSTMLGTIKWFGRWRCYAFYPLGHVVLEPTCLRDIADFCKERTITHWARPVAKK